MNQDTIHGLTLRACAEIMSKEGELKAKHGEPAHRPHFIAYLASRGTTESTWARAWNGWWTRMQADPSGQLHAKFHAMQQELTLKAHFADVPDQSQDIKEGVTLETYARVMAQSAGGQDMQAIVAQLGITWAQFTKAQAAWNTAMAADVNHHLTTQYGQLYAKYTPGFQAQMQGQVAGIMAADHALREAGGTPDEPDAEYTLDDMRSDLTSSRKATRWDAAHHIVTLWDVATDRSEASLDQAARRAIIVAIECLERHDEHTVSQAETLASDLRLLAAEGFLRRGEAAEAKSAIERCMARARDELTTRKAALAPIVDKAVPERVKLQAAITAYRSLLETLAEIDAEWDETVNARSDDDGDASASPEPKKDKAGFFGWFKALLGLA